jgi:hypothetical protein
LETSLSSKRITKKRFVETKMNKLFNELDKLENLGLTIESKLKVIERFMIPELSYIMSNNSIQKDQARAIDARIRRIINNFVKGQKIQRLIFIHH